MPRAGPTSSWTWRGQSPTRASTACRPVLASTRGPARGGATARAEIDALNLAARLTDGQQIIIPARAKGPVGVVAGPAVAGGATATDSEAPINVGTASVDDLDTIEGIGPVTAQKILEFRDQHGGISSVDQLDQIDGIGPATMDTLRSRLQP